MDATGLAPLLLGRILFAPTAVVFVAGWMLRDHGLWFRRRAGAGTGRDVLITAGGLAQIVGAVAVLGVCATLRPELSLGAGGPLLILVAPPILAVGAVLQWWLRRLLVHR